MWSKGRSDEGGGVVGGGLVGRSLALACGRPKKGPAGRLWADGDGLQRRLQLQAD